MFNNNDSLGKLISAFRKEMKEELEGKRDAIANGTHTDITMYKQACGIISGLQSALAIFNDAVKNLEVNEEDID